LGAGVARRAAQFVAANPPNGIRRERTRYCDAKAHVIASQSRVSDLATGAPLQTRFSGDEEPAYLSDRKAAVLPIFARHAGCAL